MGVAAEDVQKGQKRRSQEAKVGRVKYTLEVLKRVQKDIEEIKLSQRTIFAGLKGTFHFEKPFIERICCQDEVDAEILWFLYQAGGNGFLPKDLTSRLHRYGVRRHQVTRRILRMNKRLEKEIGQTVAERRGWKWALTRFAVEVWGEDENGFRAEERVHEEP
jgi:hypothetical protein